jgi:DNA invertase Pin-like site-specific DNA recombinase
MSAGDFAATFNGSVQIGSGILYLTVYCLRSFTERSEMIEKCKAGEIDLIITKQVSRFARNVLDSLNYIFMLRKLDPPVGVYFEAEKLNTLDRSSDMVITVLSLVAQSESEQKSNSLKWSFKRRRAQGLGIYPNWSLLGYKDHDWEIDEDEADVVRTIYSLYLEGYSSTQIADLLTKSGILTVKGLSTWSSGSVLGILRNEKYCGDALCQKTVTVDLFTHKSVKNNGLETQYFIEGHHAPIIEKHDWLLVQQIVPVVFGQNQTDIVQEKVANWTLLHLEQMFGD